MPPLRAQAALRGGMEALNQAEISSALQVYFNLRELPQARPSPACPTCLLSVLIRLLQCG